jgi:hypothetical protein
MTGIIFLNYKRKDYSINALFSITQIGCDYELLEVEMFGISAAINYGFKYFFEEKGYNNVAICSNDIIMPSRWLDAMVMDANAIPQTGMSAIHCVEHLPPVQNINGVNVHPAWGVFGCSLVTKKAFDTIGYFNTDQDPYGMQDSDYSYRLHKAGFLNYYIHGMNSTHVGADVGNGSEYRKMKDEGLNKAGAIYNKWCRIYDSGKLYLPYEQENYIIEMNQYYEQ